MTLTDNAYTIYLLHFDVPIRGVQHYLGIALQPRLDVRIREHQTGNGSSLTKALHRQGIGFTVARLFHGLDHAEERRMKIAKHYDRKCPICRGRPLIPFSFPEGSHFEPVPKPRTEAYHFTRKVQRPSANGQ